MIELSSSWELEGRRKLSDILFIKEVQMDDLSYDDNHEDGKAFDDLIVDASSEFASKPVILHPYQHPEVSSAGACCIMIRLSTQRPLRIIQLVLISSSPHIDFVDRYGEPLARIEGAPSSEGLFRCSSGLLSPHNECVVRFSETPHLASLVLQHIGVYTACTTASSLSNFNESTESHTQEIIKLSSFLGSPPRQIPATARFGARSHGLLNQMKLSKSTTTTGEVPPRGGLTGGNPSTILEKAEGTASEDLLYDLCDQFLASLFGAQQSVEFWKRYATYLFASLVHLSMGDLATEKLKPNFFQYMHNFLQSITREDQQQRKGDGASAGGSSNDDAPSRPRSQSSLLLPSTVSAFSSPTSRSEESIINSICSLSANINEIRQTSRAQLGEIVKRLTALEAAASAVAAVDTAQKRDQSLHHQSI